MPATGPKRLNWEWEELVLACDLLMQNNGRSVDHQDQRAVELSQVLRQMRLHPQEARLPDFRNANGVAQKTRNLVQHLPGYTGSPSRGSAKDGEVVEAFLADPEGMRDLAESIRASVAAGNPLPPRPPEQQTQPVSLTDITREAVLKAIAEYDELGQDAFLEKYGFHPARSYLLVYDGKRYDSKAIVGAAHGYLPGRHPAPAGRFSGGEARIGPLLRKLGFTLQVGDDLTPDLVVEGGRLVASRPGDWTGAENRVIVDDYLEMLAKECAGQPYSKTEHRNALIEAMGGTRSRGSVEMKHQNISAVMLELGLPYIKGYKPLPNIQEALLTEVRRRLETDPEAFAKLRPQDPQPPSPIEARLAASLHQVPVPETPSEPRGRKVDYGLLQEESKRIGDLGEEFVLRHEKEALEKQGRPDLAADVIWAARENGDGLGYDIRSFTPDGHFRYIEVKATKLGALTPFYITSAELDFARRHQDEYAIYRVFNIDGDTPEFYVLAGNLETQLSVEPVTYRARPAQL